VPTFLRVVVVAACVSIAAAWVWARTSSPELYGSIDRLRIGVGYLVAVSVVAVAPGMISTRWLRSWRGLRAVDVAVASALATLLTAIHFLGASPLAVTGLIGLLGLALYSRWRNAVAHHLDRLFLGDLRERASLDAIETERSRLARDLHDEPLQQLAGVIKRLETRPETAPESDLLRDVADQLRAVATDLHPPVLDDLGLVPAIEFIAARIREDSVVTVDVQADAGYHVAGRPPAAVELAIFRIVQEALTNAVYHSRSAGVRIHGIVSSDHIEISIVDGGVGLTPRLVSQAMRDGRLGLASMRRRAEAIDGDLDIRGKAREGTTVTIRWSA
jgi:signal transduction histidine kinase